MSPLPTAADIIRMTYEAAAELRKEMTGPGGHPEKLDFSVVPVCSNCISPIMGKKPSVCSACKSAIYCSKKCQVAIWKVGLQETNSHKYFCESNKRHMQRVPQVQAILEPFPWGKLESDGTFNDTVIRAYFGVLGVEGLGYWTTGGGTVPHQRQPTSVIPGPGGALRVNPIVGYQDGYLLLDQHLDDDAGWKLEDRYIPKLRLKPDSEPVIASSVDIVDWKSWYQWRGLPLESPAALLMHYPLTVYQLLVHVLHLTSPTRNSPGHRQTLNVHYLGPEVELNMLPIFSELALLLPYTDIKLTFFGFAVYNIVRQAKKKSIAAKANRNEAVYTYTSPPSLGGSTLMIYLHGEHENWHPSFVSSMLRPHAIVGLNAGLLNYTGWRDVIIQCHVEDIPFAVTEYCEQSAEQQRDAFPIFLQNAIPSLISRLSVTSFQDVTKPHQYPIVFNPFQRPGQRNISPTRVPNVPNGFTMKVVGKNTEVAEGVSGSNVGVVAEDKEVRKLADKTENLALN